jgi:hypothetical protein
MEEARAEVRKERRRQREEHSNATYGAMIGGGFTMLIAVVWFVVGFFAGWVFCYPPILFVLGLISFVCGLMTKLGVTD